MHAEAVHLSADAGLETIFADDVVLDRTGIERLFELARAIVGYWTKYGAAAIAAMPVKRQIFLDEPLRHCMHRHESDLAALALTLRCITP
jgi:hypothetical protein